MKEFLSDEVKKLLSQGKIEEANVLLGEPYSVSGVVERGRAVGRTFGYPTANVACDEYLLKFGVYKTVLSVGGKSYLGLTNVGSKPTFSIDSPTVETTLLNFEGDLYGKEVKVEFLKFVRPLIKFGSAEELAAQIAEDIEAAKN